MTTFRYRAYDASGTLRQGEVEAVSADAALAALATEGKYPVEIGPALESNAGQRWWEIEIWSSGSLKGERLAGLIRDLATLLNAQVPLEEALRLCRGQPSASRHAQRTIAALHAAVLEGAALSEAMRAAGGVFPDYVCQLVQSGERSGKLGPVLTEIAGFLEASAKRRSELGMALLYPAILLAAAMAALTVVVTVLVPTIQPLFRDAGVEPPRIIAVLAGILDFVSAYWPLLIAALVAAVGGIMAARRSESWLAARDRLLLALPGFSSLITATQTGRFARTLGTLLLNGVPLLDSVRVVAGALENRPFRAAIAAVEQEIKGGGTLSHGLAGTRLFADLHVRLVAIGERTGELGPMLHRIAGQAEEQVDRQLRNLLAMLAPLLTLLIGGVVGSLILSVMGAITSLNELAIR